MTPVLYDATPFVPDRASISALRSAVQKCRGCPLYRNATQAVFGAGLRRARLMLVGEQPGNDEDLSGRPFVGPAGRVLDEALRDAGIDRSDAWVTNAVKHFKWVAVESKRIHKKPSAREVAACRPWLDAELQLVQPDVLVCLGATAAQSLLGRAVRVTRDRGKLMPSELAPRVTLTIHPSAVLRQRTSADRRREMRLLVRDLAGVAELLRKHP